MAVTYIQRNTNSNLSGGADFSYAATDGAATTLATLSVSTAAGATEISYGFTAANIPSTLGATGNYTVEINVQTGNNNILGAVSLTRVNSSGVAQTSGTASAEQTLSAGTKTYSFTSLNLGTWASGDRLRIEYRLRNSDTMVARAVTLGFNTTNNEIVTPFATLVTATGSATLGAMTASVTALVKHTATCSATLGDLSASSTALVKHVATGSATLGGLSATATAAVSSVVVASASLGGMTATGTALVKHSATGSSTLGDMSATSIAVVKHAATGSATLNGISASASAQTSSSAIASANLGAINVIASAVVTPPAPTPPTPTPTSSGGRQIYSTTPRKKIEPLVEMPLVEVPIIEPKKRYAVTSTSLGGMSSQATAEIAFSILEDESELLLML